MILKAFMTIQCSYNTESIIVIFLILKESKLIINNRCVVKNNNFTGFIFFLLYSINVFLNDTKHLQDYTYDEFKLLQKCIFIQ